MRADGARREGRKRLRRLPLLASTGLQKNRLNAVHRQRVSNDPLRTNPPHAAVEFRADAAGGLSSGVHAPMGMHVVQDRVPEVERGETTVLDRAKAIRGE